MAPLISLNKSWLAIKQKILICGVDAHLVVISFIVPLELECRFFCRDRPAESIQSARRKLEGQELITEKAATHDFGKLFFKSGRLLLQHHLPQMCRLMKVISQFGTLAVLFYMFHTFFAFSRFRQ